MKSLGFLLAALTLLAVTGCSHDHQGPTPDQIRQDTAKATRTAAQDAKAAVQGVEEGLKKQAPININKASVDDLETLPGIDEARARRIIANRPYGSSDELVNRRVLSQAEYDRIANGITAQ
jgi:DNA uptake protein ComE-like DNA-binding protein